MPKWENEAAQKLFDKTPKLGQYGIYEEETKERTKQQG